MNKPEKITNLHNQAMEIAEEAYFVQRKGEKEVADKHFRAAFELEKEAALLLLSDYDIEPTRSVLFKGAAQLAFNFGDFRAMEKIIDFALSGNPNEAIASELRQLLVDTELEISKNTISKV